MEHDKRNHPPEEQRISSPRRILTACLGQCVHVAGTFNFMRIAELLGYTCKFMGPATPISKIITEIDSYKPDLVGLGYRLTPKTLKPLLQEFKTRLQNMTWRPHQLWFGGTPETVHIARQFDLFDQFFEGGESHHDLVRTLRRDSQEQKTETQEVTDLISRIQAKKPFPILRAHLGLPSLKDTTQAIRKIAESGALDIISIAPDQNTQAHYFHPEDRVKGLEGAGGVPLESRDDFLALHNARLRGNFPLLRIYAGTRDFIPLANLYQETIQNAWAAIPIFWFNQMDGRGPLSLRESIAQHLDVIRWHANHEIPVEINDPHHWSLRDAPDAIAVADMYLCALIAKKIGVKHFIAQYMFNTPPSTSFGMDLAKILAKDELLSDLEDENFHIIRQVRTGLASFPLDLDRAKGHLAATTLVQLAVHPDIIHVVTYSEADHAATASEIIESCKIVDQVVERQLLGELDFDSSTEIQARKAKLMREARWIVDIIPEIAVSDTVSGDIYLDPEVLTYLVSSGIFDAPHLKNNQFARGEIYTKIVDGACVSWDPVRDIPVDEIDRIKFLLDEKPETLHSPLSKIASSEVVLK